MTSKSRQFPVSSLGLEVWVFFSFLFIFPILPAAMGLYWSLGEQQGLLPSPINLSLLFLEGEVSGSLPAFPAMAATPLL